MCQLHREMPAAASPMEHLEGVQPGPTRDGPTGVEGDALLKEPREGVQPVVTRDDHTEAEGDVKQPPAFPPKHQCGPRRNKEFVAEHVQEAYKTLNVPTEVRKLKEMIANRTKHSLIPRKVTRLPIC